MPRSTHGTSRPLIRWVGGKTKLLTEISARLPQLDDDATYFEPFVGGGAVWLHLRPSSFVVNDANAELINFYATVRDAPEKLCDAALLFDVNETAYYEIRAWDRDVSFLTRSNVDRAARFLYLNRTCFNGIWRVNAKSGYNNVPWGRPKSDKQVCDRDVVMRVSEYIAGCTRAEFRCGGFELLERDMKRGDVVYLDPPYVPISRGEAFVGYTKDGFTYDDQVRLRDMCARLDRAGVKWVLSNSWCDIVQELYDGFSIEQVDVNRMVAAKTASRKQITEAIVTNTTEITGRLSVQPCLVT